MGEVHLDLDTSVSPIQATTQRTPISKREVEWEALQQYVQDGILAKVVEPTPCVSNMVIKQTFPNQNEAVS